MIVLAVDEDEYREAWREYAEERKKEAFLEGSKDFFHELLEINMARTNYVTDIPEELRDDLVEMAAGIYSDQIERIMKSSRVGEEYDLAAATAFLEPKRQKKVGAQAQGMIDLHWEEMAEETDYSREQYRKWAAETLINPWPPSHFDMEKVDRFKPPEDDRTFQ